MPIKVTLGLRRANPSIHYISARPAFTSRALHGSTIACVTEIIDAHRTRPTTPDPHAHDPKVPTRTALDPQRRVRTALDPQIASQQTLVNVSKVPEQPS